MSILRIVSCFVALVAFGSPVWSGDFTIRFLAQNMAPKYMWGHGPEYALGGLCGEIYREIAIRLTKQGGKVDLPAMGMPMKRILEEMKSGNGHLYCGAGGRGTDRERLYIYSDRPLYSITMVAVKNRDDDLRLERIEQLTGKGNIILTPFGTSTANWLKQYEALTVDDQFSDVGHAISLIAQKRWGRVFYYHDLAVLHAVRTTQLEDEVGIIPFKHQTNPQWMLYSRHLPREIRMEIEAILKDMRQTGKLAELASRYTITEKDG